MKLVQDGSTTANTTTEAFFGFNDAGFIDISDDAAIAMMDELVKADPKRKIEPLDMSDYVSYTHRLYADEYNLSLGDCCFMIPPEFIAITSEASSQNIVTIRQENTQKIKTGYHKRTIVIDLVFHGNEQINGYRVESPEGHYYVDGLRQLLAQFKCTPFLPIINQTINMTYDIHTVALQSIVCSTVEGFPDLMTANITLQEVDLFPYIEMHNRWFKYMIDWDLFKFYYQKQLTSGFEYGKLKRIPEDKSLTTFKISILNPRVFEANVTGHSFKDIILDNDIIVANDDGSKASSNYETYVDSDESNVHICTFQCGYSNILTSIQMSDHAEPTIQYMGGMDTIFSIGFETNDENVVFNLQQCQAMNDQLTRNNKKYSSVGFIKLESELVAFCGARFVMVDNVTTTTVPGFPGLYQVNIQCTAFDIKQSDREELFGFRPFDDNATSDGKGREGKKSDAISQDMKGLYNKISQDNSVEKRIRKDMELYPDLKLPTYEEVDAVINKINNFRATHKNYAGEALSKLPYSKYPRNPQKMFHGFTEKDYLNLEINDAGVVTNVDEVAASMSKYEGFVDPDFYVFYPYTYQSISAAAAENGDENPYNSVYKSRTPEAKTKTINKYIFQDPTSDETNTGVVSGYIDGAGMTDAKQRFINLALSKLGCPYVWGAEGPNSFDCSGYISWCLKQMGVLNSRFTTDSILSMTSIFKAKPISEAQPGDLLHFKAGETRSIGHIAIYLGNNEIVHCGGSTDGRSKVNRRNANYVNFVRAIEILPLNTDQVTNMVVENAGITYKFDTSKTLKSGDSGNQVRQMQYILNRITNAGLELTSVYDKATVKAVKAFQVDKGLKATGDLNADTLKALEKSANDYSSSIENSVNTSYSNSSSSGSITEKDLEAVARVVAAESRGETYNGQIAVAQTIFDRYTDPKKRWGDLNNVLHGKGQFAAPWSGNLNTNTCLQAVKDVFCNGKKAYTGRTLYFLNPTAGVTLYKSRDESYKRLGTIGAHTFWGDGGTSNTTQLSVGGSTAAGSTNSTGDYYSEPSYVTETSTLTNGVYKIKDARNFGRPIVVKTECLLDNVMFGDKNKTMKKYLNNDVNIFNSMFVDMAEYSGKGRMIKAFPTYVFAIVDENGEWLDGRKLWANYYVMRSLIDIQVHSTNDSPVSTATITVSNSYDNLSKVPAGTMYYSIKGDSEYNWPFQQWAYKNFGIVIGFGPKLTNKMIELKNIVYETTQIKAGARMHLRMGYGSDPLSLPVVMNGFVSDLSVGDLMTFVCVSDGVELTNAIISDKPDDKNGLFEDQESSNIISNMLSKRASFWNRVNQKWGEASKYSIEHFGLYFHENLLGIQEHETLPDIIVSMLNGRSLGQRIFTNEDQYDLCKNLYRSNYKKEFFTYSNFKGFFDGEQNMCFNMYNKTPWDAMQMCIQNSPEYLGMPMYHQFDSRFYYGLPVWMAKYRYDLFNNGIFEECKTFAQMHFIDSNGEIIDNQVTTTSRNIYTNAIVMYVRGSTPHATPTLYSDKSMDWSKMKTKIFDTSVTQDILGPDALWEFLGISQGKDAAIRVGISQLLYNWEKQYQGELFIIGDASIKPCDYIFMNDSFVRMSGLCTARTVTHSLSANTGFITTVTPGMIGFSTLQNSQMSVTLANAIEIGSSFSSFSAIRKALRDNTQYLANYYNTAEIALGIGFWGHLAIRGTLIGVGIYKNIQLFKKVKATARTAYNIVSAGKALEKIVDAYKTAKVAVKGFKLASLSMKGILAAVGTAATPGLGTVIGFAVGILADIVLSAVIDYFAYNNCVCLLPLMLEGEAFASIKSGEKLLMTNGTNMSEEETSDKLSGSSSGTGDPGEETFISEE